MKNAYCLSPSSIRFRVFPAEQKRCISITRVFRNNPPILLLDEATDALDNESRNLMEKSLTDLFIVKATLIIANRRKKTIRDAERIIVPTRKGTHWRL